ncbi:cyclin-dependent protein kinase [Meristemomyces frigidus]|uniref:Serine/threonine-protein kinase SSN3 n=1 Tax=Meristemomyces frigidus TaxID=1508187 RepID=A0AAN7TFG3_9PEZI|nr:cyclin-dependent protein kinase [Meristemomyces frigidus]
MATTNSNPPSASGNMPAGVSAASRRASGVNANSVSAASVPAPVGSNAGGASTKSTAQAAFEEAPDTPPLVKMNVNPYLPQRHINDHYDIVGFISSGTYGRVYKAVSKRPSNGSPPKVLHPSGRTIEAFAIKKFKPDKEGAELQYTGISQSAIREMALCTELSHPNLIHLVEIILESKCIFMVFEYAEHDLLQIIHHHHSLNTRGPIPASMLRSCMYQLLSGLLYLHQNWVIHRDLKPANIMVTSSGSIKIGDLGLARLFYKPLHPLYNGDKVVVTIWYRAPELLLGSRHYTPAIDLWACGCIFAELLSLRPIFKGEEAKQDSKKAVPFQRNQMGKIGEILGLPKKSEWPLLQSMPEFGSLGSVANHNAGVSRPVGLEKWFRNIVGNNHYAAVNGLPAAPGNEALDFLRELLEYDPLKRMTAEQALKHPYFVGDGSGVATKPPSGNCFQGLETKYPARKVSTEAQEIGGTVTGGMSGSKRSAAVGGEDIGGVKKLRGG